MVQIVYIMIYMLNRFKPLLDDVAPGNDYNKLMEFKVSSSGTIFCKKARADFLAPLLEEMQALDFNEKPNYDMFRFFLVKYLLKAHQRPDTNFSWVFRIDSGDENV